MSQTGRFLLTSLLLVATAFAADRTKPELSEPEPWVAKSVQSFKLSNGLPVYVYPKPGPALVSLQTLVTKGWADDPNGQAGLTHLLGSVLEEGAGGREALALAEALELLGADLSVWTDHHGMGLSLDVTTDQFDAAAAIFRDVLLKPDFPEAEIERAKNRYVNGLIAAYDEVGRIGRTVFFNQIYGAEHPYGQLPSRGWPQYRALTRDQLRAFHRAHFHAGNMAMVVSGALSAAEVKTKLEALFGSIPAKEATAGVVPKPPKEGKRRIVLVDKPGAAQSYLGLGHLGVPLDSPDYYAVQVMNTILGGTFASRLNQNIREENGYAYNAYSYFVNRLGVGPFYARSDVQTDATAAAVGEFFNEFTRMRKDLSEDDVRRAKNYLTLGYPGSFARVDQITGTYIDLLGKRRPVTMPETYTRAVNAVTLKDVRAAANKYLKPKNMLVVVVGDRAKVEAELKALKLGKVTVASIEQALGEKPSVE
ncbi:M16 family metallopeptidase [Acanthopleuribacter pedis]|uniref:Insulinase family protein n=1 Tax=Acanthopleuribacter pedis TaxID=442870 RepID=A0A8J7U6E4_9BACT|nr:pitrilysin family protein [Acanthopleuribacter pedis]MBO1320271.1 insulinase family protein [Acanthopleuribacter pedis]